MPKLSFGVEYEFADISMDNPLPEGLTWNNKDYSIVSSTGIANDPKGKVYRKGAEINSIPTDSYTEQLDMFVALIDSHPEANVNHRTNLHLHVGVPGLSQDLDTMKRLFSFIVENQDETFNFVDPIPDLVPQSTEASKKGETKRRNRRKVSHHYKVPDARVPLILGAESIGDFLSYHCPIRKDNTPAWGLTTRAGINMLQLKETETIEFRHFTCTRSIQEMESCFSWVEGFVIMALEGGSLEELKRSKDWKFPPFLPYNHAQEVGYQWTNFDKNSRKVVTQRVNELSEHFDIYNCKAEDIAPFIVERSEGTLSL